MGLVFLFLRSKFCPAISGKLLVGIEAFEKAEPDDRILS